jgi:hypothetical protein
LVLGLVVSLSARAARAELPPSSYTHAYSRYEDEAIKFASAQLHASVDPAPEGKRIESIEVISLEVIEPRDPAPKLLNAFHVTTRRPVLIRESLLSVGEPYRKVLADETARNLRRLPQLSLVVVAALKGHRPDHVRLLVLTKDVWSIRLSWNAQYGAGGLQSLVMEPSERNLAGQHQTLLGRFVYDPAAFSLGLGYRVRRLQGHWLSFVVDGNVIVNQSRGAVEGSYGGASITRPLYSAQTEWSWGTGVAWRNDTVRRFVNANVAVYRPTPDSAGVPWQYAARRVTESAFVTRSFGWALKNDFTTGVEFNRRVYRVDTGPGDDPQTVEAFVRARVPTSETRIGPYVQWHSYTANYLRVLDLETLGLQEDYALGHDVLVRMYPVLEALGSTRSLLGTFAAAQYTWKLGDGLIRAGVETVTEWDGTRVTDGAVSGNVRLATPRFSLGRLIYDAAAVVRYENSLNRLSLLGGDTRLRGYPSNFLIGKNVVVSNLEWRTRPLQIFSMQLGGVLFYDMGDAYDDRLRLYHSVGIGFRALFPQLDRVVFRGDLGVPLSSGAGAPVALFLTFDQAFPASSVGSGAVGGSAGTAPTLGGALGQ